MHVLNGERYKEVCPENTLLNSAQLRSCIISPLQKKPLLKRENALGVTEDIRIFLPVEVRRGGGWRSETLAAEQEEEEGSRPLARVARPLRLC